MMDVKARIPGTIMEVSVKEGDAVQVRQLLGKVEAMKMEQPIPCPAAGTVKSVKVAAGDKVKAGQVLFVVE